MTDVLQADIFFFIASAATVIFLLLVAFILFQVYKVVRLIRSVLERVEAASEVVSEDAANIRQMITSGGVLASVMKLFMGQRRRRSRFEEDEE